MPQQQALSTWLDALNALLADHAITVPWEDVVLVEESWHVGNTPEAVAQQIIAGDHPYVMVRKALGVAPPDAVAPGQFSKSSAEASGLSAHVPNAEQPITDQP